MTFNQALPLLPLALLVAVLAKVAVEDIARYLIPHRLIGAVFLLYAVYLLAHGPVVSVTGSLVAALVALLVGMALFFMGVMGGGDVKLLAVLVLWAGPEDALSFLMVTSVFGGLLTLLVMSPWWVLVPAGRPRLHVLAESAAPAAAAELRAPEGAVAAGTSPAGSRRTLAVPYGVAIAAAGILLAAERAYLVLSVH